MAPLTANAPAKVNLHLHITGRRNDGYHTLDSLVAFTDWLDHISIYDSPDYQLNILNAPECPQQDNLVTHAVNLIASHFNIKPNIRIDLTKSIPMGAGLGGGSANAAATLLALRDFWKLDASDRLLQKFASELGSDIVACLQSKPVIMYDTGNILQEAPQFPTLYALLVKPQTSCPTALVYKKYAEFGAVFSQNISFPNSFESTQSLCDFLNMHTRNDLTQAAIAINPEVGIVLKVLENLEEGLMTRLSGSGSACYTIFENEDLAIRNKEIIQGNHPTWIVRPIRINA